jgi:hypothetical protein
MKRPHVCNLILTEYLEKRGFRRWKALFFVSAVKMRSQKQIFELSIKDLDKIASIFKSLQPMKIDFGIFWGLMKKKNLCGYNLSG